MSSPVSNVTLTRPTQLTVASIVAIRHAHPIIPSHRKFYVIPSLRQHSRQTHPIKQWFPLLLQLGMRIP